MTDSTPPGDPLPATGDPVGAPGEPAPAHGVGPHPEPWPDDPQAVAATAYWRTEHQTFIPLPALQQAVFTIHVNVQTMAQAIATPRQAAALRAALSTMSDAVLAYRGLGPARDALLAWLAARAST